MDRPVSVPALFAWYERSEAASKEDGKEKSQTEPRLSRTEYGRKVALEEKRGEFGLSEGAEERRSTTGW